MLNDLLKKSKLKLKSFYEMVRVLFELAPRYAIQLTLLRGVCLSAPIARLYTITGLIYQIEGFWKNPSDYRGLLAFILLIVGVEFINGVASVCFQETSRKCNLYIKKDKYPELIESIAKLEYDNYENRDVMDRVKRVKQNFNIRILRSFSVSICFIETLIKALILVGIITNRIGPIGLTFVFVSLPLIIAGQKSAKNLYESDMEAEKHLRYLEYVGNLFSDREVAAERSLFKLKGFFTDKWENHYSQTLTIFQNAKKAVYRRAWISELLTFSAYAFAIGTLCWGLINGHMSYGLFVGIIVSIISLMNTLSYTLAGDLAQMGQNKLFLDDYKFILNLSKEEGATEEAIFDLNLMKIEFDNVTFTYPNATKPTLNNLSFVIESGKKYAFVGENGAGKSTIIKLLLRLYKPDKGKILVNGKTLEHYSYGQIKGLCSVVFQDYSKYPIRLTDSLCLGSKHCGQDKMVEVLKRVGLNRCIDENNHVRHYELGKLSEEGLEFSEGQWQRLSIARALMSEKPLLVLDEATASIDPIREMELYELFKQASENKTTVFITHRLGSTKFADTIYVLKDGNILEKGNHMTLMQKGGIYQEMYSSQSRWYE